jgi:multiple sugar transport system substrate-binding protein
MRDPLRAEPRFDRRRFGRLAVGGGLLAAGAAGALSWRALAGDRDAVGDVDGIGPVTLATERDPTGYLAAVIDRWNAANPAEPAQLVDLPDGSDDAYAQLTDELGAGSGHFDVLNMDLVWTAEFAARGWIAALDETRFPTGDLLPAVVRAARWSGRLHAVPYVANAPLLFYRTDVLRAAGEGVPRSWAELSRLAARLAPEHRMAGYAGQFFPYEGLTVNALEAIRSAGGRLLEQSGGRTRVVVDSPAARTGLEFLAGGLKDGWIPKEALGYQEQDSADAFTGGRLLFLRNWPNVYQQAAAKDSAVAGKFGVARLPGPHGPGAGVLGGSCLAVNRRSARQRTARRLIAHLTGEAVQRLVLTEGGLPPVRTALYRDPALIARHPYLPVLHDALRAAVTRPGIAGYQQLSLAFCETCYDVLRGGESAAGGLARLSGELREIVSG